MNRDEFILMMLSLVLAALSLLAHGWTLNGIGTTPRRSRRLAATVDAVALRHRSWRRRQASGFAPATQHFGAGGAGRLAVVVAVVTGTTLKGLRP